MIRALDTVVLKKDLPEHGLSKNDLGAIVHCYGNGETYEVEFLTTEGKTISVVMLEKKDIVPLSGKEILQARSYETATV